MSQNNTVLYARSDVLDEEININLKKIFMILWSRKKLIIKIFGAVLLFFILLTFILPKKYKVTADLYINKTNNSNMVEINPFVLDEATGTVVSMGADKTINNEIELMKSSLVLDKVIKDNDIKYKKGKKKGEYVTAKGFYNKGKYLKIENIKNTNIISIEYTAKNPQFAYNIVSSLIDNYEELHRDLNSEKSKADKKLLEAEYEKAKENLNTKLNQSSGLPAQTMNGLGNLSAMSAFSRSASQAIGNIRNQYLEGERSQIAVTEEKQKLTQLASKLEWAKMVEQMSNSSKVLVINEPRSLRSFENCSPKLLLNIILGCILGSIISLICTVFVELNDEKLTYSMLGDNIIYDILNNTEVLKAKIFGCKPQKILLVSFAQLPQSFLNQIQNLSNCEIIYADLSDEFMNRIASSEKIIFLTKIFSTNSKTYKLIKEIVQNQNKQIAYDALL